MQRSMHGLLAACLLLCSLAACQNGDKTGAVGNNLSMAYAQFVQLSDSDGLMQATVLNPWQQGNTLQAIRVGELGDDKTIRPLRRVVVFTTSHCQLLAYLGLTDRIVGVCDLKYILVPDVQRKAKEGKIVDCGDAMSPNIEKIIESCPDAIFISCLLYTSDAADDLLTV